MPLHIPTPTRRLWAPCPDPLLHFLILTTADDIERSKWPIQEFLLGDEPENQSAVRDPPLNAVAGFLPNFRNHFVQIVTFGQGDCFQNDFFVHRRYYTTAAWD